MYKSNIRNKKSRSSRQEKHREVVEPGEDQEYAYVQEMSGNGRLKAYCQDGKVRIGKIRGAMRKFKHKVIINTGDIILISKRDYEEDKVDVIHKYTFEEANTLNYRGDLPEKIAKVYQNKDCFLKDNHPDSNYVVFADAAEGEAKSSPVSEASSDDLDIDEI